jgi:adenine C2-methylase RlmN of 23S rRNA A2503 and tRNA A37
MAKKKHLFDWTGYAANKLISATVENAAPQDIVLTFTDIRPFRDAVFGEFTTTGTVKTVDQITKDASANTITVHVTVAFVNGNTINCVYNPTKKGDTVTIAVTNNVEA